MRKNKTHFTFMVTGKKCTGKSTFLNTLLNLEISSNNDINMYLLDIECEGLYKSITAIDTPGLNAFIVDRKRIDDIVKFIKHQHDLYLAEETKVKRDANFKDTRVHCLIYFLSPSGISEYDIKFLLAVNKLVNIIPVIGKGDSLNREEEGLYKIKIRQILQNNKIDCFDLKYQNRNIDQEEVWNRIPFCIVGSESRIRDYESGRIEVDNPSHCDFSVLKDVLFNTHCESLIELTDVEIYERYRTEVLSGLLTKSE